MPKIKFFTKEILDAFAKQGDTSQMEMKDIKIIAKFFNPTGAGTWYCYEYDPNDGIMWCFANLGDSLCAECGTVSVAELQEFRGKMGLGIERDIHFPVGTYSLELVYDTIKAGGHL